MNEPRKPSGRLQLLLIAAVFFGPLIVAIWLYTGGESLQPAGRSNNGALLEPIVNLGDTLPGSPLTSSIDGRWLLIFDADGACREACQDGLYTLRQSRLMLGREMDRLDRILLHRDSALDTLFLSREYEGTIPLEDTATSEFLKSKIPVGLDPGGFYLLDPRGNLVMYFDPGLEPGRMVDDIKRLLKLSRIG